MATPFPARCNRCGKLGYAADMIQGPAGGLASISGITLVQQASCKCGGDMVVLQGDYSFNSQQAILTKGPTSSWEALQELARVVKASMDAGESAEKTIERAAKVLPSLGKYKGYLANAVISGLTWLVMEVASIKLQQELTPAPITQEQTSALIESSEQRILEAIAASRPNLQPEPERLGLRPYGNPMLEHYPITARKLAEENKKRRRND